ncbi:MAG TPA: hypothetical protein VGD40_10685 [Chryseosolibacter sp.]
MVNLLLDILLFAFFAKKRTPASLVIVISLIVLIVLVGTVITQATFTN